MLLNRVNHRSEKRGLALRASILITALMAVAAPADAQRTVTLPTDSATTWLGLLRGVRDPMEPPEERRLPVVRAVFPCSPAHAAGLEPGDLLVTVNSEDARRPAPFSGPLGAEYEVVLDRAGERVAVTLVRAPRPQEIGQPVRTAPMGSPADWKCPAQRI